VLHMLPLEAGFVPLTCRLRMKDGRPNPPGDAGGRLLLRSWPGGVVEAVLSPERIPRINRLPLSPASASRVNFMTGGRRMSAEWANFGDWWLVVEDTDGTPLMTQAVPEATGPGSISVQAMDGRQVVVAQAPSAHDQYCVAIAGWEEDRWQVLFTDTGHEIDVSADGVTVTRNLGDTAGHRRSRRWRPGEPLGDRLEATAQVQALGGPDVARAFLEALALGLDDEASAMLTPVLREGLSITEVRNFFGDIHEILPCRYGPPSDNPGWAVARPAGSGLYEVTPYVFTVTDGLIDNIMPG